jgi:hypothetical protein
LKALGNRLAYATRHNRGTSNTVWRLNAQGKRSAYTGSETIVGRSEVYKPDVHYVTVTDALLGQFLFPRSHVKKEHVAQIIRVPMHEGSIAEDGPALHSDSHIHTDNQVVRYDPRTGEWKRVHGNARFKARSSAMNSDRRHFVFIDTNTKERIAVPAQDDRLVGHSVRVDVQGDTHTVTDQQVWRLNAEGERSAYMESNTIAGRSEIYKDDPNYISIHDARDGRFLFPRPRIAEEHIQQAIRVPIVNGIMAGNGTYADTALRSIDDPIPNDDKVVRYISETGEWEAVTNGSCTGQGDTELRADDYFSFIDSQTKDLIAVPKKDISYLGRNARVDVKEETYTIPDIDKQKIDPMEIASYQFLEFLSVTEPLEKALKSSDENGIPTQVTIDPSSSYLGIKDSHGNTAKIDLHSYGDAIRDVKDEFFATRVEAVGNELFAARAHVLRDEDLLLSFRSGKVDLSYSATPPFDWPQLKLPLLIPDPEKLQLGSGYKKRAAELPAHVAKVFDKQFTEKLSGSTPPRGSAEHDKLIIEFAEIFRNIPNRGAVRSDKRFEQFQAFGETMSSEENFEELERILGIEARMQGKPLVYTPTPALAASKTQRPEPDDHPLNPTAGMSKPLLTTNQRSR